MLPLDLGAWVVVEVGTGVVVGEIVDGEMQAVVNARRAEQARVKQYGVELLMTLIIATGGPSARCVFFE